VDDALQREQAIFSPEGSIAHGIPETHLMVLPAVDSCGIRLLRKKRSPYLLPGACVGNSACTSPEHPALPYNQDCPHV
jgi:hypothetical protein